MHILNAAAAAVRRIPRAWTSALTVSLIAGRGSNTTAFNRVARHPASLQTMLFPSFGIAVPGVVSGFATAAAGDDDGPKKPKKPKKPKTKKDGEEDDDEPKTSRKKAADTEADDEPKATRKKNAAEEDDDMAKKIAKSQQKEDDVKPKTRKKKALDAKEDDEKLKTRKKKAPGMQKSFSRLLNSITAVEDGEEDKPKTTRKKKAAAKANKLKELKKELRALPDSNAPKRPMSAYIFFVNAKREFYVGEDPSLKSDVAAVSARAGAEWKGMSEEDRAPYQRRADEARKLYKEDVDKYLAERSLEEEAVEKKREVLLKKIAKVLKDKKTKEDKADENDEDKPKQPATGYFRFMAAVRRGDRKLRNEDGSVVAEIKELKSKDVARLAGITWKSLEEDVRDLYNAEYRKEKEAYDERMEEWKKSKGE
ncbi:hypothetical protein HK101_006341 [Irineochytrium annulatum]|nr:hypothetical protein HK101_006341 [Irineochytrium annulatum]